MKKLSFTIVVLLMALIILSGLVFTACGEPEATTSPTATSPTSTSPTSTSPTSTSPTSTSAPPTETTTMTTTEPPVDKYGGTLTILYPYNLIKIPGWPSDTTNFQRVLAGWTIFEALIKIEEDGTPVPWLATSWEWNEDHTNVTFNLRQGVNFHDGTPFTSESVKIEAEFVIANEEAAAVNWDRWEIIDDNTIRLYLKKFENNFWTTLYGVSMMFFSPTAYHENGEEYMADNPIGTGPFKYDSFEKDVHLTMTRNDDYWQEGKPYLDEIVVSFVVEALTRISALQAGDGDVIAWFDGKNLYDMQQLGYDIHSQMGGTGFIMFDTINEGSVFKDVNVRMAIEHAIDKEAIVGALGYGFMEVNNQMTPSWMASHNTDLPSREYDVQMAKDLLAAAGYPDGFSTNIITQGASEPRALIVQEFLRAINIETTIELVDNPKYWDYMLTGWTNAMIVTDYAVNASYPAFLRGMFPPTGIYNISVKIPDEVIEKIEPALAEPDPVIAKELSDELIRLMWEDCQLVPTNSNAMGYVLAPYVKDSRFFEYFDWTMWDPENTWLDK